MQVPILNGIYTDTAGDFRVEYPRNMVPVILQSGISDGYFRPADGIVSLGTGPGIDRGGIEWQGILYRVMGTKLVSISSTNVVTVIGDVGGTGQVTLDYSFDYLAIASGGNLFLYRPSTGLQQVTDPDLGTVVDVVWVDGYFMTTDGEFLIVTELNDPFSVNPLKYGSAEADPDPVVALLKVRNEVYALNRHTIEVFDNVGGSLFPFQRVEGAQVQRGAIGTHACCLFMESIAFIGGGRNEAPAVWLISGSNAQKISTREIDLVLEEFTETQLSNVLVESRVDKGFRHLYIHLPDRTLVFDAEATTKAGMPVWFTLTSSLVGNSLYRARNLVWVYNKWVVGDPSSVSFGYLSDSLSSHWGVLNGWEFATIILYNESRGLIFHEMELIALTGNAIFGTDPSIWTSHTEDGLTWSQERVCKAGVTGVRGKRLSWLQQGRMRQWRAQKFRGTSDAQLSVARLEARIEPLAV
jgi:hypothetical protein